MKLLKIFTALILITCYSLLVTSVVWAETLESDSGNYKIDGVGIGTQGGEDLASDGGNYSIMPFIGDSLNTEKLSSLSYSMGTGTSEVLNANVPLVQCFETTTEYIGGSGTLTECEHTSIATGNPGEPVGMVRLCGEGGCYDRARIEIDEQNNPSDTLYAIQITTTSDWSYYGYIDGNTRTIKSASAVTLDDFLTKVQWEDVVNVYNILGLTPGTEYFVRVTALQGDFTQSAPGPYKSAITAYPALRFELNVGSDQNAESSPIHNIRFNYLSTASVETADKQIWLSYGTNWLSGIAGWVVGNNDGLYSSESLYTITSDFTRRDLASLDGFGIVNSYSDDILLGPTVVTTNFVEDNYNVGGVVSSASRSVFNTSGSPLYRGMYGLKAFAKISMDTPTGDYEEVLTFTLVPSF